MDKNKIIAQLLALLQDASAVQCDLALTFVERMTGTARNDKSKGKSFTLTESDAISAAYIIQDAQDNPRLLHEILIHAQAFEKVYRDKAE